MKKIQLRDVLDEYEEKTSWTFLFGNWPPIAIIELHKVYNQDLATFKDNDLIPNEVIRHISQIAVHYHQQWTEAAENALHELNDIIQLEQPMQ
jgi:hypothetical protein